MTFDSDQAKKTKKQDRFDFSEPAEKRAASILSVNYADGFVVGIEGDWGSGKTSFINMICETLVEQAPDFKIIHFNPWLHSSHENLIAAYFKLLRENARDIFGDNNDIKEILGSFIEAFTPAAEAIANLASSGTLGGLLREILRRSGKKLKETPTLESQYKEIKETLSEARKEKNDKPPILVVIDDLDRLDSEEIKTMLKLVKSVGELPNVIYILAYNRDYVENAIKSDMPSFLEKIIQLPIPVPKPVQIKLFNRLIKKSPELFKKINDKDKRWHELVGAGIFYYIKKPRDVVLLSNSVKFCFPDTKEILDPTDFFVLECLRLFDLNLWNWIKDNGDIILGEGVYNTTNYKEEPFKNALNESLINKLPNLSKNQKTILAVLFPRLTNALGVDFYGSTESYHKTRDRYGIAIKSVYDAYFAQYLDKSEISQADIDYFLENSHNREKTTETLQYWIDKKDSQHNSKIIEFLELLSYRFVDKESPEPNQMLLWSLTDVFDSIYLLKTHSSFFNRSSDWQLRSIFKAFFEKIGKQKTNAFLQDLCKEEDYTFVAAFLLHYIGYYIGKTYGDDEPNVSLYLIEEQDWEPLTKIISPHIRDAFLTGSVGNFTNVVSAEFLAAIIFGDTSASAMFRKAYKISEQYVIKTVKARLSYVTSLGDNKSYYEFRETRHPELFDHNLIAEYAKKVDLEKQDEVTKEAITTFLDGVKNPEKNNSDRF
ncbi:MAG: KAP family P-loop NTPase fold protein [Candidatus Halichondribacter symbioticus]